MNDEHSDQRVDELLADLDRALSIDPSPAVTARVRTRVEAAASGWFTWRWSLAAAGVVLLAAAAFLAWPRASAVPSSSFQIASNAATTPAGHAPAAVPPAVQPAPVQPSPAQPEPVQPSTQLPSQAAAPAPEPAIRHASARATQPTPVRHTTVDVREPEVLVPPSQRIALEQLAAALKDGRLTTESMAAANRPIVHEPLVVPSIVIEPFKAEVLPAIGTESVGSGGGVIRKVVSVVAH